MKSTPETTKRPSIGKIGWDNLRISREGFHQDATTRMTSYVIEGILITLLTYIWLEYADMGKLYHWLFPIIVSTCIVVIHCLVNEVTIKFWKANKFNIGTIWMISFVGLVIGFIIAYFLGLCGLLCMIIGSYCPTAWHSSPPNTIAVFFKTILLPWGVSSFFLTQTIHKKQIVKELASIKKINEALAKKSLKLEIQKTERGERQSQQREDIQEPIEYFTVPLKVGYKKIAIDDICFIVVEDHYCKIVIDNNGEQQEEWIRSTLKEALDKLPGGQFAQTHRSYVVNLHQVKKIKKEKQSYHLFLNNIDDFVPASRHRAQTFLPKLTEFLS